MRRRVMLLVTLAVLAVPSSAQSNCLDAAEDSHYSVVFQNNRVRVLALELGRLQKTGAVCNKARYLSIVTTPSQTTRTVDGTMGVSREWVPGEARFHYKPVKQTIRNETLVTHREVFVETFLPVQYSPYDRAYDTDEFGSDLTAVKPTWSTSFTRGALTATRVQLAPGDHFELSGGDHILIALSDLDLTMDASKATRLPAHDVTVLRSEARKVTNTSAASAKFVVVDF